MALVSVAVTSCTPSTSNSQLATAAKLILKLKVLPETDGAVPVNVAQLDGFTPLIAVMPDFHCKLLPTVSATAIVGTAVPAGLTIVNLTLVPFPAPLGMGLVVNTLLIVGSLRLVNVHNISSPATTSAPAMVNSLPVKLEVNAWFAPNVLVLVQLAPVKDQPVGTVSVILICVPCVAVWVVALVTAPAAEVVVTLSVAVLVPATPNVKVPATPPLFLAILSVGLITRKHAVCAVLAAVVPVE